MEQQTIFDIGFHLGRDTAYYLYRGYRVVAVEAAPDLVEDGRDRFKDAIDSGKLTLIHGAISDHSGEADFWISENPEWHSLNPEFASRRASNCKPVKVPLITAADLFSRYGTPHYLKVDIEGNDRLCIDAIDPDHAPRYLSFELTNPDDVRATSAKGYDQFKLINQMGFAAVDSTKPLTISDRCKTIVMAMGDRCAPLRRAVLSLWRAAKQPDNGTAINGWRFSPGSSGPFGEDTPGSWVSADEVIQAYMDYHDWHDRWRDPDKGCWFDVHAASGGA